MTDEEIAQREMEALSNRARRRVDTTLDYTELAPLQVKSGPGRIIQGDLIRYPTTISYEAGKSISNSINNGAMVHFPNVTRFERGGSGLILGAKLTKNNNSIQNCGFRLWLYQDNFALMGSQEDNTPMQIRFGRRALRIGFLDFTEGWINGFDCAEAYSFVSQGQSMLFNLPQSNSLYGLVQTTRPYADAKPGEIFSFFLHLSCD